MGHGCINATLLFLFDPEENVCIKTSSGKTKEVTPLFPFHHFHAICTEEIDICSISILSIREL